MPLINNQQGGFQGYSVVTRDLEGDIGPPAQIFNLTQTATSITEGQPVTFVVDTENVIAGTNLYWKLSADSTASAADFSGAVSGVVSVSSKSASVTLTSIVDTSNEGDQIFTVEFYKDAAYTNLAVAAAPVTIVDILFGEQIFSASAVEQTWTVPEGVTSISVIAVGGGGGGAQEGSSGSGTSTKYSGGGGGGGGALVYRNNLPVTPGQVFKLVAGPGGAGAAAITQKAGNGTASYFSYANNTAIMIAGGGGGGYGNPLSTVMNYNASGGPGGVRSGGSGGGNGGAGGWSNMSLPSEIHGGGGGGAGGYYREDSDYPTGGDGFWQPSWTLIRRGSGVADSSLGGGGGGGGSYSNGGGVGIYGKGGGGGGGTSSSTGIGTPGTPGSLLFGEAYGGGAGLGRGAGGNGVVRIMWPGEHRQFPLTNTYPTDQTYGLSASTTNLVEGYTMTFTVNTSNVVSGTNVYWKFSANSTATAADFTSNITGMLTISGGTASFSLTAKNDLEDANETFAVELYKNSDYSDLLAVSQTVTISSPAFGEVILSANAAEQTWTVPSGVASISVLAVGGGGGGAMWTQSGSWWAAGGAGGGGALAYKTNIPVVAGQTFKYRAGPGGAGASNVNITANAGLSSYFSYENNTAILTAGGGNGGQGKPLSNSTSLGIFNSVFTAAGGTGGTRTGGDGGGNGGAGGSLDMKYGQGITGYDGSRRGGGGGGAAGYAGNGGNGQMAETSSTSATAGSGGGGGGGSGGSTTSPTTGRGGGVGIYGQGTSGAAGAGSINSGFGGNGSVGYSDGALNVVYGAGAGVAQLSQPGSSPFYNSPSNGGDGVIRIIWPGNYRAFPSTNTYSSAQSYSITPSADYVIEGSGSVSFTVNTSNVTANTVLYWNLSPNSTASVTDFVGTANGTVTINSSGQGFFGLVANSDGIGEVGETFSVELYREMFGTYRELVAVSPPVTVIDAQPTTFPTGGIRRELFTTTGLNTWTVPEDWTSSGYIVVALRGAGGGGATTYNDGPGGSGGGGGALVLGKIAAVPGQTLYINVGQAVYNANGTSSWINTTAATPPTSILQGYLASGGGGGGYTFGGGASSIGSSVYFGGDGGSYASGSGGGGGAAGTAAYNYLSVGDGGSASGFSYGVGGAGGGVRSNGGSTGGSSYYNEGGGAAGESTNRSGAGGGRGENGNQLGQPRSGGSGGPYIGTGDPNAEYAGGGGGGGARASSGGNSPGSGGGGGLYGGGGGGAAARQGGGAVSSPGMGGNGMVLLVYFDDTYVGPVWQTSRTLSGAYAGVEYTQTLVATGATSFFLQSGSSLPPGLTLSANGVISGTPTGLVETNYSFTVVAADAGNNEKTRTFSLNVAIPNFPITIGQPWGGGYYAGKIEFSGTRYYLIVSPKASGESNLKYKTTNTDDAGTSSRYDGLSNSNAMNDANHPAAQFCMNLTIDGYSDWYMPSLYELEICYYNLKPGTANNATYTGMPNGANFYAVPSRGEYTASVPAQTTVAAFQSGGSEAFEEYAYFTSTEYELFSNQAWSQNFSTGYQSYSNKDDSRFYVRAIRKIPV